ncbi:uncharacterized protein LOC113324530 [Papaver somniferum]|uniref:uncharacterized protein LOC113324530 n=1 Tax=Papaver somniferum TaxID=3469 RepID=UPI000E6F70B3|nr:uncharacterized protein LOC113324530 [Papaver somniferum]
MSPYEDVYSRAPPTISSYLQGTTSVNDVDFNLRVRDHTLKLLKFHLQAAQARMKSHVDNHRTERSFAVNDWVFLRLQPYRQSTVAIQSYSKISHRFFGPFKIIERIGEVAYKLELPAESRIHPVFHVSQLKLKLGSSIVAETVLPNVVDYEKWEPDAILERKMFKKDNKAGTKWLIQWKDHSPDEATWEDADDILLRFPDIGA